MTVQTETSRSGPYAGAGTTGPFTVGFRFLSNSHLQVIKTSTTGIDTTLALTTDYSVSGAGGASGSVTLVTALAVGEQLTIVRDVPFTQLADYVNNDAFPAESHEDALDLLTMQTQQNREVLDRSLTLPATVAGVSTELPTPEGLKVIGWNAAGTALENLDANTLASIVSYGTANSDLFSGNGVTTQFTLSGNPASINNLDVSVGGVAQRPGIDYTWVSGTTITFDAAPASGTNNILVRYMQALAMGSGVASDIQYTPAGTGAVVTTVQSKLRESVSVKDFGAVADGVISPTSGTDNGPFFRAALLYLANQGGGVLKVPRGVYRITSTVIIPNNVVIEGGQSTIVGPGIGSATDLFRSGYLSGGAIVTNIGTAPESNAVSFSIKDLIIYYAGKAFSFYNVLSGSVFEGISIIDATTAIYADRCFYSAWDRIDVAGTAGGATGPAVHLVNVNNVMDISSMFIGDRPYMMLVDGGSNGLKFYNCGFEGGGTGVVINSETGPIAFDTCYFENLTGEGVNLNTQYDKNNISFTNCFFNYCAVGVQGVTDTSTRSSISVDGTNRFVACTTNISFGTNTRFIQNRVTIPFKEAIDPSTLPVLPTGYTVNKGSNVDCIALMYSDSTGLPLMKTKVHGDALVPFEYEGDPGATKQYRVAFTTKTEGLDGAGPLYNGYFDTRIKYSDFFTNMLVYSIEENGAYMHGFIFGTTVRPLDSTGRTLSVSNVGGYVRLTVGGCAGPGVGVTGVLRFI